MVLWCIGWRWLIQRKQLPALPIALPTRTTCSWGDANLPKSNLVAAVPPDEEGSKRAADSKLSPFKKIRRPLTCFIACQPSRRRHSDGSMRWMCTSSMNIVPTVDAADRFRRVLEILHQGKLEEVAWELERLRDEGMLRISHLESVTNEMNGALPGAREVVRFLLNGYIFLDKMPSESQCMKFVQLASQCDDLDSLRAVMRILVSNKSRTHESFKLAFIAVKNASREVLVENDALKVLECVRMWTHEVMSFPRVETSIYLYSAMFSCYARLLRTKERLLDEQKREEVLDELWRIFLRVIHERSRHLDTIQCNILLQVFLENGHYERLHEIFGFMKRFHLSPDDGTIASSIVYQMKVNKDSDWKNALVLLKKNVEDAKSGSLRNILSHLDPVKAGNAILESGFDDIDEATLVNILHAYRVAGDFNRAFSFFAEIPKHSNSMFTIIFSLIAERNEPEDLTLLKVLFVAMERDEEMKWDSRLVASILRCLSQRCILDFLNFACGHAFNVLEIAKRKGIRKLPPHEVFQFAMQLHYRNKYDLFSEFMDQTEELGYAWDWKVWADVVQKSKVCQDHFQAKYLKSLEQKILSRIA